MRVEPRNPQPIDQRDERIARWRQIGLYVAGILAILAADLAYQGDIPRGIGVMYVALVIAGGIGVADHFFPEVANQM